MEASLLRDEVLAELIEVRRDLAEPLKRRQAVTPPCKVSTPASHCGGLLPWGATRISRVYQVLIWLLAGTCTIHLYMAKSHGDAALGLGAILGLPACWRPVLGESLQLLQNMGSEQRRGKSWRISGAALFLWALVLAWRIWTAEELLPELSFGIVTLLYVALACMVHHCCDCLLAVIDDFCSGVAQGQSFEGAVQRWNAIHATCLKICTALQHAFLVLLALAIFEVPRALPAFTAGRDELLEGLPVLLIVLPAFRALTCAAAITDNCAQVPPLVNSITTSEDLDAKRMHAVQHIFDCQTGFTVFGVRITSASLFELLFIASIMTPLAAQRVHPGMLMTVQRIRQEMGSLFPFLQWI